MEERDKLILENLELVERIVGTLIRRYGLPSNLEKQDLISVGTIAMIQAIDSYSKEKGDLEKWISSKVFGAILDEIRTAKTINSAEIHLDPDRLGKDSNSYLGSVLEELSRVLTEEEYIIFQRCFVNGETQKAVAEDMGISHRTIQRKIAKIRKISSKFI